jgi:hypothetical protein
MTGEITLDFLGTQIERLIREVRDLRDIVTAAETKLTSIERQGLENARALLQLQLDIGTTVKLEMGSAMLKLTERFEHLEDRLSRTHAT